jgi:hypothetical protein
LDVDFIDPPKFEKLELETIRSIAKVEEPFRPEVRADAFNDIINSICKLLKYDNNIVEQINVMLLDDSQRFGFLQKFNNEIILVYEKSHGKLAQPKADYWTLMVFLNNPHKIDATLDIYEKIMRQLKNKGEMEYTHDLFDIVVKGNSKDFKITLAQVMQNVLSEVVF